MGHLASSIYTILTASLLVDQRILLSGSQLISDQSYHSTLRMKIGFWASLILTYLLLALQLAHPMQQQHNIITVKKEATRMIKAIPKADNPPLLQLSFWLLATLCWQQLREFTSRVVNVFQEAQTQQQLKHFLQLSQLIVGVEQLQKVIMLLGERLQVMTQPVSGMLRMEKQLEAGSVLLATQGEDSAASYLLELRNKSRSIRKGLSDMFRKKISIRLLLNIVKYDIKIQVIFEVQLFSIFPSEACNSLQKELSQGTRKSWLNSSGTNTFQQSRMMRFEIYIIQALVLLKVHIFTGIHLCHWVYNLVSLSMIQNIIISISSVPISCSMLKNKHHSQIFLKKQSLQSQLIFSITQYQHQTSLRLSSMILSSHKSQLKSNLRKINSGQLFRDAKKLNGQTYLNRLPTHDSMLSPLKLNNQVVTNSKMSNRIMGLHKCRSDTKLEIKKDAKLEINRVMEVHIDALRQLNYSKKMVSACMNNNQLLTILVSTLFQLEN